MTLTYAEPAWMVAAEAAYDAADRALRAQEAEQVRELRAARFQSLTRHVEHVLGRDALGDAAPVEWHFEWPELVIDGYRFGLARNRADATEDFVLVKRCQQCQTRQHTSAHINDRLSLVAEKRLGDFRPGPYQCGRNPECQPDF